MEVHQITDDVFGLVRNLEDQVLVLAPLVQVFQQVVDGGFLGIVFLAQENHRAGVAQRLVVVLGGVLEDFLKGAGAARRVDDTALRDGDDVIFPDAVVEELGDFRGEGRGGLVAVEPGGDAQAVELRVVRVFLHHLKSVRQPARVTESGGDADRGERVFHLRFTAAGEPGAQMDGFHGSRSAAADHQFANLGEPLADLDDLAVVRVGALDGVAAHDGDDILLVVVLDELFQGVADGMVVQDTA